jgi:hypothetical protein
MNIALDEELRRDGIAMIAPQIAHARSATTKPLYDWPTLLTALRSVLQGAASGVVAAIVALSKFDGRPTGE